MIFQAIEVFATVLCPVFTLYRFLLIIAILMTWVNPDPYNPIVQWIYRLTRPVWNWCAQYLPASLQPFSAYAALLLVLFLHAFVPASLLSINFFLQNIIPAADLPVQMAGHALQGLVIIANSVIWFAIIILGVWFFLTLVSPAWDNPIVRVVYTLADPLITPIQKYLPRTKIDLSPIVGIAVLYVVSEFLITPIYAYGVEFSGIVRICI